MADKVDAYMTLVGAVLWLAASTRPDLAYPVSVLARFVSNPALAHYRALQRMLLYVRDTAEYGLNYRPKLEPFHVYSDANWAEKHSTCGACYFAYGCLIAWYSRLQRSIAHSTAEAEYVAASMAAREGIFHREVLQDIGDPPTSATILYLDSKSAIDMAFDPVAFKKTKHILRDAFFLRDVVARDVYLPKHVITTDQLADPFTKALNRVAFNSLRIRLMGVTDGEKTRRRSGGADSVH